MIISIDGNGIGKILERYILQNKLEDLHKEVKDEEKGENSQEKINNLLYKQMVIGLEMNTGIIRNNNNPY